MISLSEIQDSVVEPKKNRLCLCSIAGVHTVIQWLGGTPAFSRLGHNSKQLYRLFIFYSTSKDVVVALRLY